MKEVKRYQCEYCKKVSVRKGVILKHEQECLHNPDGKNCYVCKHACIRDSETLGMIVEHVPFCALRKADLRDIRKTGLRAPNCDNFEKGNGLYDYRKLGPDGEIIDGIAGLF